MSTLRVCYDITKKLWELISSEATIEDRDYLIREIDDLLNQRGEILTALEFPRTDDERELGKQILTWNAQIDLGLKKVKTQIKEDAQGIKTKKQSVRKYVNPYADIQQSASVFYDKKK